MRHYTAQSTSRVVVCCLIVGLVAAACYAASPERIETPPLTVTSTAAEDALLSRMLTPRAEIRLGCARADTDRLMRRASQRSLSYTLTALTSGIVEYVFPLHGLFRRGDELARLYDPELLGDLARARRLSAAADVSPLTIAATQRRPDPQPAAQEAEPADTPAQSEPSDAPDQAGAPPQPEQPAPEIDFDFPANMREQQALRDQAALTARLVSSAGTELREALDQLNAAREELEQRRKLLAEGVLSEQAMRPALEREERAQTQYEQAEAVLLEAQAGYDRLAERIGELERDAAAAHEAMRRARERRARRAERAAEGTADETPEVELRRAEAEDDEPETAPAPPQRLVREVHELAAPRWDDVSADAPGMISEVLAPEGSLVEPGDDLLRIANIQLARLTARIAAEHVPRFHVGRAVSVHFADYPETAFEGWVASLDRARDSDEIEVELLVVCDRRSSGADPYPELRRMTLEAGVGEEKVPSRTLEPVLEPPASARTELQLQRIFPTVGPAEQYAARVTEPRVPRDDRFTGRLSLQTLPRYVDDPQSVQSERMAALREWRESYIDGMTTTVLDDGTALTFPAEGEVSRAVRAMLDGRVSHRPHLCAGTMREALGWGLGDAHQWARRLPRMGFVAREDGLPRPGDILVWPFTYGPSRSQHIGIAVRQGRRLMLLSNLDGRLGTSEIPGGYIAFHQPETTDATS